MVNMQHSVSAQKVQSHSKVVFTIISPTICFIWKATFHAVLCVCMWIMHVRQCVVGLHGHKMYRKCPEHLSSTLLTTAVKEKQTSHRLLFLCLFSLFTKKYECICYRFYCRQCCHSSAGIFKWNFDDFLWETVWNVKESELTCGSYAWLMCSIQCGDLDGILINVWLLCTVNVQHSVLYTKNLTHSDKYFFYKLSQVCNLGLSVSYTFHSVLFFFEKLCNVKGSVLMCGSCIWLMCRILIDMCVLYLHILPF